MTELDAHPELAVRPAMESDLVSVEQLTRDCIARMLEQGIDQWDEVYPSTAAFRGDISSGSLYVASDAGALVGVFVLDGRQDPEYEEVPWSFRHGRVAVVHRLMVHPRAQGRGVARALMAFAELRAEELGYDVIRLDAFSLNPQALRLYRNLDYREAGEIRLRKGLFKVFEKRLD